MSLAARITRHYGGDWSKTQSQGNIAGDGHSPDDRSVSIKDAPDRPDGILVHCHGAGDWQAEMDRFRRDGLLPAFEPKRANGHARDNAVFLKSGQRIVQSWQWRKEGRLLYRTHRIEPGPDGRGKEFRYDRPDGAGGWLSGRGDEYVAYRHDELADAPPGTLIFMAEGERKADRLASWGLLATSSKHWRAEFTPLVEGSPVIILPDNDAKGREIARQVWRQLTGVGARVCVMELPGLPAAGDILDWAGARADLERLAEAAFEAAPPEWLMQGSGTENAGADFEFPHTEPPCPGRIKATPFRWRDPATIPPRQWLYGRNLIRKFLSLDIAPAGVGKSSVKTVEALAMTTGLPLLDKDVHGGPLRVWLYNLEDPAEETERRLHAAAQHYRVSFEHVGDRLFVDSGRDQPICIAEETESGACIVRPVVEAVIAELQERQIDVLCVDPFVSSHAIGENDNRAIDMVAKEWSRIADVCNCAINLVHHVRKTNGAEVTAESSRGAVSLIAAARVVTVYNRMTEQEAERAGIDQSRRGFYFRKQHDKANLAPCEGADWFRMESVDLPNGDSVGVASRWQWPDAFEGLSTRDLYNVQVAIDEGEWADSVQAKDWAGKAVADVLGLDVEHDKQRIKSLLRAWKENGALTVDRRSTPKGREKPFLVVGEWVDPTTLPTSKSGVEKVGEVG